MSRRDELHDRLDRYSRFGSGPELDRLASETEGQELVAAFACVWRWKGWVGAATDAGLYLARNPKLLGRSQFRSWRWADLKSVRTGATMSVSLAFASEEVELKLLSTTSSWRCWRSRAGRSRPPHRSCVSSRA